MCRNMHRFWNDAEKYGVDTWAGEKQEPAACVLVAGLKRNLFLGRGCTGSMSQRSRATAVVEPMSSNGGHERNAGRFN